MPKLAVVGAGLIGRSWAVVFAGAGWDVALFDADPAAARNALAPIAEGLSERQRHGLTANATAGHVRAATSLADALEGADLAQENTKEDLGTKRAVFAELDRLAPPGCILASSTSMIVASRFTEKLKGRARCLVAHPVNPPHLVPVVELVGAPWTSSDVIAKAKSIYGAVGQVPIVVNREIDGFILNRLQAVLLSEAFRLAGEGYVSPQDLDKTLKDGLGLRWAFMGPFETIELNAPGGIADYCTRYGPSLARLSDAAPAIYAGANLAHILQQWGATPPPEKIAGKMQIRDVRLAALRAHLRTPPSI